MCNLTFYEAKMKGHKTNDTRTTFKCSSFFPVKADKEGQPILRQMKHYQMSLEYPYNESIIPLRSHWQSI